MTKQAIRKIYQQKRRDLSAGTKEKFEDLMLIHFQNLHQEIPDMIMTYSPIEANNEFSPFLIEEYCFFKNPAATLVYPVIDKENGTMQAFAVKEDTLFDVKDYGIEEPINGKITSPEAIGLMIVPLLAFNEQGYRVGYGKGYYDAFIEKCRPGMIKAGFSFFDPVTIDNISDFDKKMDYCITPNRVYHF